MTHAVAAYKAEQAKEGSEKKKGLRAICADVARDWWVETGKDVKLNHVTLGNLAKGGRSLSEFNADKSWLMPQEVDLVIEYAQEVAARGFPLSHKRLKEHVDAICQARLGSQFPEEGVGKRWTDRFVEKYSDRLSTYNARPLEGVRGCAVNPTTNEAWYELLGETLLTGDNGQPIAQECCWAADEAGFQPAGGTSQERLIGAAKKRVQHQQRGGSRENIMVIVTIGADGSSLPPAVIFKGKAYQSKWKQDNPANAS
jgi:hypothetical protein